MSGSMGALTEWPPELLRLLLAWLPPLPLSRLGRSCRRFLSLCESHLLERPLLSTPAAAFAFGEALTVSSRDIGSLVRHVCAAASATCRLYTTLYP